MKFSLNTPTSKPKTSRRHCDTPQSRFASANSRCDFRREVSPRPDQPPILAKLFVGAGHDAVHLRDVGLSRSPDPVILERAAAEHRVLVSADTDFGELLARSGRSTPSILLLRRQDQRSAIDLFDLISINLVTVQEDLDNGAIVVFDDTRIRIRNLPITT